ncbi:MAG: response regulator [Acidobacteria bacterium]|nr:response regulator [Acidobacteriota bacterium]
MTERIADRRSLLHVGLPDALASAPVNEPPAPIPPERILCVDDEPNVLEALKRQFRKQFRIDTAVGPELGLTALAATGPYAVVISDLRMPSMDGIQFLTEVRSTSPDTIRVMLTGQADLAAAIAAVNQGAIFRFLLKPCPYTVLGRVIEAAIEQHRLVMAERQLTEKTLLGCVRMLTEILSAVQPDTFSRTVRLRRYVQRLIPKSAKRPWIFEAAAMLSQIGWITLSPDILEKLRHHRPLDNEEEARFREHAKAASHMLGQVPRLEPVAAMIEGQFLRFTDWEARGGDPEVALGAQLLRAASDFDQFLDNGDAHAEAMLRLRTRAGDYNPELVETLRTLDPTEFLGQVRTVRFRDLTPGMVLEEDLLTRRGELILGKGQETTDVILHRLNTFLVGADAKVRVRLPGAAPEPGSSPSDPE